MHSQVVVLGGGPGGYAAAFMAADLGLKVTLVEADPRLGGTCLLRGCIPSKALLHVAKVISEAREMTEWGVAFGKMKLNVDTMRARKEKVIDTLSGGLAQLAKRRKVKVVNARGIFVDSQTLQLEGGDSATYESERLTFDHCILATGSVPAMPGMFDIGSDRVMDSTGALLLADVPKTLLVIGGGYIGLEMGTVYAQLGSKVSVVELTDGLLPGADRDLVKPLMPSVLETIYRNSPQHQSRGSPKKRASKSKLQMQGPEMEGPTNTIACWFPSVAAPPRAGLGWKTPRSPSTNKASSRSTNNNAPPTRTSWRSATSRAIRCSPTKPRTKEKSPPKCSPANPPPFDAQAIPAVVFTDPEIAWAGLTAEEAKRVGRKRRHRPIPLASQRTGDLDGHHRRT